MSLARLLPTVCLAVFLNLLPADAHDTWLQVNTPVVRSGETVYLDLLLGNHGNEHRDFLLASKVGLEHATLKVYDPSGREYDVKNRLIDTGYTPKEGYWSARFNPVEPGMYLAVHSADQIVNHGRPTRSFRSAKVCFVASKLLDKVPEENPGFDRVFGHPLEIIPEANPVTPSGPEVPIRIKVLLKGKPFEGARVSFIPRGVKLADGFDETYERKTNANGRCSFTPKEGNHYLVVVHHKMDEAGDGYTATAYSATLAVLVPDICPCCGE